MAGEVDRAEGGLVTLHGSLVHHLRVNALARGQPLTEQGVGFTFGCLLSVATDRGSGGHRLDAAAVGAVALAGVSVDLDDQVAKLGTGAGRATVDLAVQPDAPADAGADREQQGVTGSARGTVERLGEHREVSVVVDRDRQMHAFGDHFADRQILQVEVHGADRVTGLVVQGCGDSDTDRLRIGTGFVGLVDLGRKQVHDPFLRITFGRHFFFPKGFGPPIDNTDGKLRTTQISPD